MSSNPKWAYDLEITLVRGEGFCAAKHKIGDQWFWSGDGEQIDLGSGICVHALSSMLPKLTAMRYGAKLPWLKEDADTAEHLCPDASAPHIFSIRRTARSA